MKFSEAEKALKAGKKIKLPKWEKAYWYMNQDGDLSCVKDLEGDLVSPSIVMKTADDRFCVGWLASQTDMLAHDWYEVQ